MSILCGYHWKMGIGGERRPKDRVKTGFFRDNSIIPTSNLQAPTKSKWCRKSNLTQCTHGLKMEMSRARVLSLTNLTQCTHGLKMEMSRARVLSLTLKTNKESYWVNEERHQLHYPNYQMIGNLAQFQFVKEIKNIIQQESWVCCCYWRVAFMHSSCVGQETTYFFRCILIP